MTGWGPLDLTCDGIVLLDENQVVTVANARALEFLHCMLPAVAGRDFWQVVPPEVATQHQAVAHHALTGSQQRVFTFHHTLDDSWVEYTLRRHPAGGFVVNMRDVNATHRLQHLLDDSKRYNRMIFEANPNAMWVFDWTSRRIFAVNQAAIDFYGIPRKVFMSLKMEALFPAGEGAELLRSLHPGAEADQAQAQLRLCRQRKLNGQELLVELAWSPVNWDGHQAVLVSLADISQRHLADSALRRANAELEQALQAQQAELRHSRQDLLAFTQAASGDLQDSLHVAHGFSARLAEKYSAVLDEQGRHYVHRIQASIAQLTRLLDDLRALAQLPLRAGRPELLDLAPLCHSLMEALRKQEPQRNVTLEMQESLPLVGSMGLLGAVMGCLLENAWKFTSKKAEAWIRVELLPGKTPAELVVRVSDNGAGFDSAYSSKLFTPFQRLHSSADFPGNGLGLAIVKRAAELQDGRVWAQSSGLAGASFFMALPLPQRQPLSQPEPELQADTRPGQ